MKTLAKALGPRQMAQFNGGVVRKCPACKKFGVIRIYKDWDQICYQHKGRIRGALLEIVESCLIDNKES